MIDFSLRALRHPTDYLGVLKWHRVKLVRTEHCVENIYSFVFEKPPGLSWKAGQHGVCWFFDEHLEAGRWRAFSIASSAYENELRIATIIPETPSAFKQKLNALKPGQHIWLQGPFGEFHASEKTQLVGIAGGIGITPFRALAYEVAHKHLPDVSLTLIYSAQNEYAFKDELDTFSASCDRLTVIYTHTPEEVNQHLEEQFNTFNNTAYYCISGSPGMIKALTKTCKEKGVTKIVSDPFKGY